MWNVWQKYYRYFFWIIVWGGCTQPKENKNQLNKVYHHQICTEWPSKSTPSSIELGSLVCYFSTMPIINSLSKPQKNMLQENLVFFFPKTSIASSEAKNTIKKLHALDQAAYKIRFEEVQIPTQGLKLSVSFDPQKVSMKYDLFDSIGLQKGIVFRFFNQQVLKELNNKCCKPILNTACAKKPSRIVVDCGHGGADFGTVGIFKYPEKTVTLNVGLELARLLKKEGFEVELTRACDVDVSLDNRTSFANQKKADLFVSIHANSAPNKNAQGIETFWMDPALLKSIPCTMDPLSNNMASIVEKERCAASNTLARSIHTHVLNMVNKKCVVVDRSIRTAVSQVLLGSAMPSALIEVGFLSNSHEAHLLEQDYYQKLLAHGICNGVKNYATRIVS